MILGHYQAVLGLLSGLDVTLYEGQVPNRPAFPYAVFYMDTGQEDRTKLCGTTDEAAFRFQVTSVGLTATTARRVADAARALVLDVRPVVTGRSCGRIQKETSIPVRPDTDVVDTATNRHPLFAVDTYVFYSRAA